jgi:hypothetical protein
MLRLELFELVEQRVEFFVGDLGGVVDVVLLFVVTDKRAEPVDFRERGGAQLPIAGEHVIRQCQQRVALGARRERVELRLRALGVLFGAPARVVDRGVQLQIRNQLLPDLRRRYEAMTSRTIPARVLGWAAVWDQRA